MKLLFTDLDDTLLSTDKTISEGNLKAIKAMTDSGHGFVLCTGRPLFSAMVLAKQYGFIGKGFYIASYNGGLIVDTQTNKELYHEGVSFDLVKKLFTEAPKRGLNVQTYQDDYVLVEEDSEYIIWYSERIRMPYRVVDDVLKELKSEPLKCIVAHRTDHEALVRFQKEMAKELDPVSENLFSNPVLLEYGSLKATKGIAIEVLCKLLGVDIQDSIACGDEENDIAMIKTAGIGVAVKNAVPSVIKAADFITENDNNHDAIKEVIYKFVLK